MIARNPTKTEVDYLASIDGKTVFSIQVRDDKNFEFYVESLLYDPDEELEYWSQQMLPKPHIFATIADAKAEILAQYHSHFAAN